MSCYSHEHVIEFFGVACDHPPILRKFICWIIKQVMFQWSWNSVLVEVCKTNCASTRKSRRSSWFFTAMRWILKLLFVINSSRLQKACVIWRLKNAFIATWLLETVWSAQRERLRYPIFQISKRSFLDRRLWTFENCLRISRWGGNETRSNQMDGARMSVAEASVYVE
jgi:hypothetical protein